MKRVIVVANRTGGQGKTLLAHLLVAFSPANRVVLCADSVEPGGLSKLGRMVSGVVELGAGPTGATVQEDAQAAYGYWDALGETLFDGEGPVIIDVGANVIDRILEWGVVTGFQDALGDSTEMVLAVPVVARPKSLSDAADVIRQALDSRGGIPFSEILVVRNGWQGGFVQVEGLPEYAEIRKLLKGRGRMVDLPRCDSGILAVVEEKHLFFGDVAEMGFRDLAELFGWDRMKAARDAKLFRVWFDQARDSLARVVSPSGGVVADGRRLVDPTPV